MSFLLTPEELSVYNGPIALPRATVYAASGSFLRKRQMPTKMEILHLYYCLPKGLDKIAIKVTEKQL